MFETCEARHFKFGVQIDAESTRARMIDYPKKG